MRTRLPAPFREVGLIFLSSMALIKAGQLALGFLGAERWFPLWTALVFLLIPLLAAGRGARPNELGLATKPEWRGIGIGLAIGLPIIFLFALGDLFYRHFFLGKDFVAGPGAALIPMAATQAIMIAFPEELFFRGCLQGRLEGKARASQGFIKYQFLPILIPALLFALAHFLVSPSLHRLGTFFPGLLFGFVRAKTGTIYASILLHTVANLTMLIVEGGLET